jgi:hypothetical protein
MGHKTDRPCALGVLLDGSAAKRPASPITRYLQGVAQAAGADLLWGFCDTTGRGFEQRSANESP